MTSQTFDSPECERRYLIMACLFFDHQRGDRIRFKRDELRRHRLQAWTEQAEEDESAQDPVTA